MSGLLPPVGVTALIAGMAAFNRDAAAVEGRLLSINRAANQLERQSEASFLGFGGAFGRASQVIVTGGTLIAGAAVLAGGAAIKMAADFESSLKLTQALTGATGEQMVGLRQSIVDLSRNGVLGLDDLSKAATELGRAGVDIPDIMNGALQAVENLTVASGGELGLEKAAKLTASAMHAFGISVENIDQVTTAATVVAQNSALTFTDFGTGVQYAGATFKAAGFNINDLAVGMTLLGKNGVTASVAATTLRGIVQRMINPTKAAKEVMDQYGISLFNTDGTAKGFDDVLGQLRNSFSDQAVAEGKLTAEERLHAVSILGLQRTGAGFLILSNATAESVDELRSSFERLQVTNLVATLMDTLANKLQVAKNNIVALAVEFGTPFLAPLKAITDQLVIFLKGLSADTVKSWAAEIITASTVIVQFAQSFVSGFTNIVSQLGLTSTAIDFLKSALLGVAAVFVGSVVSSIGKAALAIIGFGAAVGVAVNVVSAIADVLGRIAYVVSGWAVQFGQAGLIAGQSMFALGNLLKGVASIFSGDFQNGILYGRRALEGFTNVIQTVAGKALDEFGKLLDDVGAMWAPWASEAGPAGDIVSNALQGVHGIVEALQYLLQGNFAAAAKTAGGALDKFAAAAQPVVDAINGAVTTAFNWWINEGWPGVQTAAGQVMEFLSGTVIPKLQEVGDAVRGKVEGALTWWSTEGWPGAQDAAAQVVTFIDTVLIPKLTDIATTIDTTVVPALGRFKDAAGPALGDALSAAIPTLDALTQGILAAYQNAIDILKPFDDLARAWENLKVAGGEIARAFSGLTGTFDAFTDSASGANAVSGLIAFGATFLVTVFKFLTLAIEGVTAVIRTLATGFADMAADLRSNVTNSIIGINFLLDTFRTVGPVVAGALRQLDQTIIGVFASIKSTVGDFLSFWAQFPAKVGQSLDHTISDLRSGVTAIGNALSPIGQVFGAVFSAIGTTVSTFISFWANFPAKIAASAQQTVNDIQSAFQAIANILGAAFSAVGTFVNNVVTAFQTFGQNVLQTITDSFANVLNAITTTLTALVSNVTSYLASALAAFTEWGAQLVGAIGALAGEVLAQATAIGTAIVNGIVNGITAGIASVTAAARELVSSAISAARAALESHSPSRVFYAIGETVPEGFTDGIQDGEYDAELAGTDLASGAAGAVVDEMSSQEGALGAAGADAGFVLADNLIAALDAAKAPIRGTAASLVDQLVSELGSIGGRMQQIGTDMESAMTRIGEDVGRKLNEAIKDAALQIAKTIDDAEQRINELKANIAQSHSDEGQRNALKDTQDAKRKQRKQDQEDSDLKTARDREDADSTKKLNKSVADADFQLSQDLANAKTKDDRDKSQQKYNDKLADLQREFALDIADTTAKRQIEDKDRADARAREQADADFERSLQKETDALNDKLEDEALQRSIARAETERDARIKAINDALAEKQRKIQEDGEREIKSIREQTEKKIAILEKEFTQKAAEILRKGGEQMRPLIDNIQNILSGNFAAMRTAADDFTRQVEEAINALKRLEEARRRASFSAPSLPSATAGLQGAGAELNTDSGIGAPSPELPMFANGGRVPGAYGKPQVVIAHGGEYIMSLAQSAALMARSASGVGGGTTSNEYNYRVDANYANVQSQASVTADMRALIQLAKG